MKYRFIKLHYEKKTMLFKNLNENIMFIYREIAENAECLMIY